VRILYLDCLRGINAVASLAALIDAGADPSKITRCLRFLPGGCTIHPSDVIVGGLRARRIEIDAPEVPHFTWLDDVRAAIDRCRLSSHVEEIALGVYQRVAIAEAHVHGSTPEAVTFQEVGAPRSVMAIIGSAIALEILGPTQVVASPLPIGGGMVETHHGLLAVPAPATAELLRDLPLRDTKQMGELVTPTGAALVSQVASSFGPMPSMTLERVGRGVDDERTPILLTRAIAGDT
jgi:uncharacterized protein (DUF111 family)